MMNMGTFTTTTGLKHLLFFFLLLTTIACRDDKEPIYEGYGMVQKGSGNAFSILLDNDMLIRPQEGILDLPEGIGDSTRVHPVFTILKEQEQTADVNLMALDSILTLPVIPYSPNLTNTAGNAPVNIHRAWLAHGFLNFELLFVDNNKPHTFCLLQRPEPDDALVFELRHNDYDDENRQANMQIISFRLQSILQKVSKPAEITVYYNTTETTTDSIRMTYE